MENNIEDTGDINESGEFFAKIFHSLFLMKSHHLLLIFQSVNVIFIIKIHLVI